MARLLVKAEKCTGCKLCQLMCSLRHEGVFDTSKARIKIPEGRYWNFAPTVCDFCKDPPCAAACPTGALLALSYGGVEVKEGKCIGCNKCIEVCENHVIKLDEDLIEPLVCDLCGGDPVCVEICPTQAILYDDRFENTKEER